MASSADSFASNISLANFSKATELKQRIWFTIGALIVFRFLSFVPLPGINARALSQLADQTQGGIIDIGKQGPRHRLRIRPRHQKSGLALLYQFLVATDPRRHDR